jgi:hypothetical protein
MERSAWIAKSRPLERLSPPRSKAAASRLRQARQLRLRTRGTIFIIIGRPPSPPLNLGREVALEAPRSLAARAQRKARSKMTQLAHRVIKLAEKTKLKPAARRANRAA